LPCYLIASILRMCRTESGTWISYAQARWWSARLYGDVWRCWSNGWHADEVHVRLGCRWSYTSQVVNDESRQNGEFALLLQADLSPSLPHSPYFPSLLPSFSLPFPNQVIGLGECCTLPQRGPGQSRALKRIHRPQLCAFADMGIDIYYWLCVM